MGVPVVSAGLRRRQALMASVLVGYLLWYDRKHQNLN